MRKIEFGESPRCSSHPWGIVPSCTMWAYVQTNVVPSTAQCPSPASPPCSRAGARAGEQTPFFLKNPIPNAIPRCSQVIRERESHYYKFIVQQGLLLNAGPREAERLIDTYGREDNKAKEGKGASFDQDQIELITHDLSQKYLKRVQDVDDKVLKKMRTESKDQLTKRRQSI